MVARKWHAIGAIGGVYVTDYAAPYDNEFGVHVVNRRWGSEARYALTRAQLRSLGEWALRVAGPEPAPADADGDVLAEVILGERLRMQRSRGEAAEACAQLIEFLHQRREFGLAKYGKPLARENGRAHMRDALDELLDAMAYAHASREWDLYDSARGAAIVAIRKMQEVGR